MMSLNKKFLALMLAVPLLVHPSFAQDDTEAECAAGGGCALVTKMALIRFLTEYQAMERRIADLENQNKIQCHTI